MKHLRYAAYFRVSTKQQGKSGLGLDAQREAVRRHLAGNPDATVTEFVEVESGIEFVACDNPQANRLTLHILAAVAEDEARRISERTKAALEAAKARGIKLGGDRGYRPSGKPTAALSALQQGAQEFAHSLSPIILRLQDAGVSSLNALAAALNKEGIRTARGGTWHASSVKNVLTRLEAHALGSERSPAA
ncbi:recombinase family protein [Labrenzia sp. R5_0]|nr:recombinase family protein [Labrenzia sp. R5_0]